MNEEHIIRSTEQLENVLGKAKPIVHKKVSTRVDEHCREFIGLSPLVFMATSDKSGRQDVSPKGDAAGFVQVPDEKTLLIPERIGNKLAYGFRNILETGRIGIIFCVPGVNETLRINGSAYISKDPEHLQQLEAKGKPALLTTVVTIEECFFHCGKAFIRSSTWKPESWNLDHGFNFVRQISKVTDINESDVQASIDDSYKNRLY